MYLDDITEYVNSILYYHFSPLDTKQKIDIEEILMYLSSVPEIIEDIKNYLYSKEK